jgi:curved DNA-binding protein CbpA
MSEQEAYKVLGLQPGASEGEIRAAHRRLMKDAHPDHGGSDAMAARLNAAKDVLLGRTR